MNTSMNNVGSNVVKKIQCLQVTTINTVMENIAPNYSNICRPNKERVHFKKKIKLNFERLILLKTLLKNSIG